MRYSVNGIIFEIPNGVTHFQFLQSDKVGMEVNKDVVTFSYVQGMTASEFCTKVEGCTPLYNDSVLIPYTKHTKIDRQIIGINRNEEFIKVCHEDLSITQLRYKIEGLKLLNRYYNVTILIGSLTELDLDEYYRLLTDTNLVEVRNKVTDVSEVSNVEVHNSNYHKFKTDRVYLPNSKYRQFRISALDYLVNFFGEMSKVFEDYGFQLVEYEKLKDADSSNIVTFRINTHAREFLKRTIPRIPEHNLMYSGSRVSFALMTSDTDIYEDFRDRYTNLDIVQNRREFKCEDKYGDEWRYDCIWQSQLDDSFSHDFPNTEFGAYGYQFMFTATLEFYDVYDVKFDIVKEIIGNLKFEGKDEYKKYEKI